MVLDSKKAALRTAERFGSNDPFVIAESLDYIILHVPLQGIRGFHQYTKRNHIIYIEESLSDDQKRWVCAHELGHALLHKEMNRIFMAHNTLFPTGRYETEANRFAACLLYPAEYLRQEFEDMSSHQMAEALDLPVDLVEYVLR